MRKRIAALVFGVLLLFGVSACTTSVKYDVLQKTSQYQLTDEKPIQRKFKLYAIESLIPVDANNELIINTFDGAVILNADGTIKATYNQQVGGKNNSAAILRAYRIVGNYIILAYSDHVATLDADNQILSKLDKPGTLNRNRIASISPNGLLALAFGSLWDLATNNKLEYFDPAEQERDATNSADFSPDNHYLVVTQDLLSESKVQLWDLRDWVVKKTWIVDGYANVEFSPDGKQIIFNIEQRPLSKNTIPKLSVYDVEKGSKAGDMLFASPTSTKPIVLSDNTVISGHRDGSINVWSYLKLAAIHRFRGASAVTAMTKDSAGRVWCGFADGKLIVFEKGQFSMVHAFNSRVTQLAVLGNQLFVETFAQPVERLAVYSMTPVVK